MNLDRRGLEILDREECEQLLAEHHFGRLAVTVGDQPIILPISYVLDGHDIVFRSDRGTKVYAACGHPVAFEIDASQALDHGGWSVLVIGRATLVTDDHEVDRLGSLPLAAWVDAEHPVWVRVHPSSVTGRRIPRP